MTSKQIEFLLPEPIRYFVFDLHQATRKSMRLEEVHHLYETVYRELTEKYFKESPWPSVASISSECSGDDEFLVYYREMTLRHFFTFNKVKPQLSDYLEAWATYKKMFTTLLSTHASIMCVTAQWAYDIIQEFVYQFQEFCQYRCHTTSRSPEDIELLEANRDAWSYPSVVQILRGIIRHSNIVEFQASNMTREGSQEEIAQSVHLSLGYFAMIELSRVECLVGDFVASLSAVSSVRLLDRSEYFMNVPTSFVNTLYHAGVCFIMLKRYADAIDTLSNLVMYVTNVLKPGASTHLRQSTSSQLQKIMEKALTLTGVSWCLCPGHRLDDQVRELVTTKLTDRDRLRKLQVGDTATYIELFENSSPKFVSPAIPNYRAVDRVNRCHEAVSARVRAFSQEVGQQTGFIKLRSYLKLYSSIETDKLAGFNDISADELRSLLVAFKYKSYQVQSIANGRGTTAEADERVVSCDINVHVRDNAVVVDNADSNSSRRDTAVTRFFVSSIKKHGEINKRVDKIFRF